MPDITADHVTLVLTGAVPRCEVQLLMYRSPNGVSNPLIEDLHAIGYNHVCFAVENLEDELARMQAAGIKTRNDMLNFHGRKLVFLEGLEDHRRAFGALYRKREYFQCDAKLGHVRVKFCRPWLA